jgi:hypothetical protein
LGAGDVLARCAAGQAAHGFRLLERYSRLVAGYGTCPECLDMEGSVQEGTSGGRDYLEHAGGLLLAVGRGLWGIEDTWDGTLVWKPCLPEEGSNRSMPYWHQGHCWTFSCENGDYWVDPGSGKGTVRFVLGNRQRVHAISGVRTLLKAS